MAVVKLGSILADIRGKVGDQVYSLAKGGVHYVKSMPASVTNPSSPDQVLVRQYLAAAVQRWYSTLTAAQRTGWEELAQELGALSHQDGGGIRSLVPSIGMKGSGINAYCSFYVRSKMAGHVAGFSDTAPIGEVQPLAPILLSAVYAAGTLSITIAAMWPFDPAARVAIWLKSHQLIYHRQVAKTNTLAPGFYTLTRARGANGNWINFAVSVPFDLLVQMQMINPSGWCSPGSQTLEVQCL